MPTTAGLGLFIRGSDDSRSTESLPLFTFGAGGDIYWDSVDEEWESWLGTWGSPIPASFGSTNLFIEGEEGHSEAGLNLFAQVDESGFALRQMNLFMKGEDNYSAGSTPLHIIGEGDETSTGSLDLFMQGAISDDAEAGMNLFLQGIEGGSVPLFLQGEPWSSETPDGLPLWVYGAGVSSSGVDLVIPEVTDESSDSLKLFVRGF